MLLEIGVEESGYLCFVVFCELKLLHLLLEFEGANQTNVVVSLFVVQQFLKFGFYPGAGIDFAPNIHINLVLLFLAQLQRVIIADLPFGVCQCRIILIWSALEVIPGEFFYLS